MFDFEVSDKVTAAFVTGVLSLIAGFIITYLSISVRNRKELEAKYDLDLRSRRIEVYRDLWKRLQSLSLYARTGTFKKKSAAELSEKLREWYFEIGGLFLSERTRDEYFDIQRELESIIEDNTIGDGEDLAIKKSDESESWFERLRAKGSSLRTGMARDVGTRKKAAFRYE